MQTAPTQNVFGPRRDGTARRRGTGTRLDLFGGQRGVQHEKESRRRLLRPAARRRMAGQPVLQGGVRREQLRRQRLGRDAVVALREAVALAAARSGRISVRSRNERKAAFSLPSGGSTPPRRRRYSSTRLCESLIAAVCMSGIRWQLFPAVGKASTVPCSCDVPAQRGRRAGPGVTAVQADVTGCRSAGVRRRCRQCSRGAAAAGRGWGGDSPYGTHPHERVVVHAGVGAQHAGAAAAGDGVVFHNRHARQPPQRRHLVGGGGGGGGGMRATCTRQFCGCMRVLASWVTRNSSGVKLLTSSVLSVRGD